MTAFFIPGVPVAQPRPRTLITAGKVHTVSNPRGSRVSAWKQVVQLYARQAFRKPLEGPLKLILAFLLPRSSGAPKERLLWHKTRPDLDNLVKAILDAMNGIVYLDDGQVCYCESTKMTDDQCGVEVQITQLEE